MIAGKNGRPRRQATTEALLDTTELHAPLSRIQRLIAGRMLASKRSKPCFYLEIRADVTDLMGMRHRLSKRFGVKITSNAFFIRALALAAAEYPLMVGRLADQDRPGAGAGAVIRIADHVNVGFAVNTARGLIVPVVKHAERQSLAEIAEEEKRLTAGARSNTLTLEDLEGETVALSNLGAYDIDQFFAICPPPVSAILAAGKIAATAAPHDGRFVMRKTVSLSLAVDHRVVDSEYAARFLRYLAEQLEDPERLL